MQKSFIACTESFVFNFKILIYSLIRLKRWLNIFLTRVLLLLRFLWQQMKKGCHGNLLNHCWVIKKRVRLYIKCVSVIRIISKPRFGKWGCIAFSPNFELQYNTCNLHVSSVSVIHFKINHTISKPLKSQLVENYKFKLGGGVIS